MFMLRRLAHPLILLWLLISAPAALADVDRVGEVLKQRGDVTAMRDGAIKALDVGEAVFQTDRIVTGPEARVKLQLVDGTVVAIGADSEVELTEYVLIEADSRLSAVLTLIRGIIRATVTGGDPPAPFDIRTQAAVASVRSTDWIVEAKNGKTGVFVVEGLVAVTTDQPPAAVLLEPEFGTDVVVGGEPSPPVKWGEARVNAALADTELD